MVGAVVSPRRPPLIILDFCTYFLYELMIKYGAGMYMPPEYRLLLSVGAMVVTVHSANSGDPRVGEALQKMSAAVNVKGGSDL